MAACQPRSGWDANFHLLIKLLGTSFASGLERNRLRTELGAGAIADRLARHVESGPERTGAAQASAGALCLAALQLGAVTVAPRSELSTYARARAEARFEAAATRLVRPDAAQRAVLHADALRALTAGYTDAIGTVEPRGFGERRHVDALVGPDDGTPPPEEASPETRGTWFW